MKRQIEFTFRNVAGILVTNWLGYGFDAELTPAELAEFDAGFKAMAEESASIYIGEGIEVYTRGPFDVPDGETGGGDGG